MLATLLPGVREIRTPLAVGYTWLITLWLAVGHHVPEPGQATGMVADVYRLANAAGLVAVGIAVSVGAYILGVIATALGLRTTYVLGGIFRRTPAASLTPGYRRERSSDFARTSLVVTRLADRLLEDGAFRGKVIDWLVAHPEPDPPAQTKDEWDELLASNVWARRWAIDQAVDVESTAQQLRADHNAILWRLRSTADPIVLEHDRLQAEAEFRIAMFAPLGALCIVTAFRLSPWSLLAFVLLIPLIYVGVASRAEAEGGLAAALASGKVSDPALSRLDAQSVPLRTPQAQPE